MVARLLWVRLSSLGDVVHSLPAIGDLSALGFSVDVLTEPAFAGLLYHHRTIQKVHTIRLRAHKKTPFALIAEIKKVRQSLYQEHYNSIIDAQGLWKSALLIAGIGARTIGGDSLSVREWGVHSLYHDKVAIPLNDNVIKRYRALAYECAIRLGINTAIAKAQLQKAPDFGMNAKVTAIKEKASPLHKNFLFLHGVSAFRMNKLWPADSWQHLTKLLTSKGHVVWVPYSGGENSPEHLLAQSLVPFGAKVLPPLPLATLMAWMMGEALPNEYVNNVPLIDAVVSVDSGLGHFANAIGMPTVMLFGPTGAERFSTAHLPHQTSLSVNYPCAPCMLRACNQLSDNNRTPPCWATISPVQVLDYL